MLNDDQLKQAIDWYVNQGISLSTIAQHFLITPEELGRQLNTVPR